MIKKQILVWLLTLILSLTAATAMAISADEASPPDQGFPEQAEPADMGSTTQAEAVAYSLASISPQDVFDIFIRAHPGAWVTEVKFETKKEESEYKVEGYDKNHKYEVRINAASGDNTKDKAKNVDKKHQDEGVITIDDLAKVSELVNRAMGDAGNQAIFYKWSVEEIGRASCRERV